MKSIILLDEVYKIIHRVDLNEEVNYRKSIPSNKRKIPLGIFANFYRTLERQHGSLGEAIVSTQSLSFLETGIDAHSLTSAEYATVFDTVLIQEV